MRFHISHVWHNYSTQTWQRYLTKLCNNLPAALKYVGAAPEQRAALHSSCWSGFWDQPWFIVKLGGNKSKPPPPYSIQTPVECRSTDPDPGGKNSTKTVEEHICSQTLNLNCGKKRLFISISLNGKKREKKLFNFCSVNKSFNLNRVDWDTYFYININMLW